MPYSQSSTKSPAFAHSKIRAHLENLHRLAVELNGKFVVSAFFEDKAGTITHHKVGDVDGMCAAIQAHGQTPGANVYTGLQLMRPDLPKGKRGGEADIVAVLGLVADMDADTGKIGSTPMEPSYVIETSPGNFQCAIIFDKPMTPQSAKRLAKALQRATGADYGTGDIAHVWRIPGTFNYPNAAKIERGRSPAPFLVTLTKPFEGLVYSEAQLIEALAPFMAAEDPMAREHKIEADVNADELLARLSDLGLQALKSDGQPDRSTHAARVVERLHFEGFDLNEVASLCRAQAGAWSERYATEAAMDKDLGRLWTKFAAPKEMQRKASGEFATGFAESRRRNPEGGSQSRLLRATPFTYQDPKTLPRRESLFADGHYSRRYSSMTVGVGGGGKSTLALLDAIAMATGEPVSGHGITKPIKVWYFNLEDPADEIRRRIAAAIIHHNVNPALLEENLFIDSGRDQPLIVMTTEGNKTVVTPMVEALIEEMKSRGIDVLIVDPFVSSHEVEENDNNKMQQVANQFVRVANEANAAVELVHHVTKAAGAGSGKNEVTADSGRGAGALKDKARSVRAINTMTEKQAKEAGIDPSERFSYFRVTRPKANMSMRTGKSEWYRMVSVNLDNGSQWTPGDEVGVAERWQWSAETSPLDKLSEDQLRTIWDRIAAGEHRAHHSADNWAGHIIAEVTGLDPQGDRTTIIRLMKALTKAGHFREEKRRDNAKGRDVPFYVAAKSPHPEITGVGTTVH